VNILFRLTFLSLHDNTGETTHNFSFSDAAYNYEYPGPGMDTMSQLKKEK